MEKCVVFLMLRISYKVFFGRKCAAARTKAEKQDVFFWNIGAIKNRTEKRAA